MFQQHASDESAVLNVSFMQVGSANLIDQAVAVSVPHFLLLSSTSVYGNASEASSETSPTVPVDSFGA
jgi:nucleoside-diphosphate-sugar epimerase